MAARSRPAALTMEDAGLPTMTRALTSMPSRESAAASALSSLSTASRNCLRISVTSGRLGKRTVSTGMTCKSTIRQPEARASSAARGNAVRQVGDPS